MWAEHRIKLGTSIQTLRSLKIKFYRVDRWAPIGDWSESTLLIDKFLLRRLSKFVIEEGAANSNSEDAEKSIASNPQRSRLAKYEASEDAGHCTMAQRNQRR